LSNYRKIQSVKGSPIQQQDSNFLKFLEAGSNINLRCDPLVQNALPENWTDWNKAMTADELKNMPLRDAHEIDLDHVAVDPVPLQPASTKNLNKY